MKRIYFLITIICFLFSTSYSGDNNNPRVAIIISKTSFVHHWGITQMAAHGWGGIVNLAGIPSNNLFAEDIKSINDIESFDCLVFGQCDYLTDAVYEAILESLNSYLKNGGNVIIDGSIGYFNQDTRERDHQAMDELLGIENNGFKGNDNFRVRINNNNHFITKGFENNQYITQHLVNGLKIQQFKKSGNVLLEMTDEKKSYPFLSVKSTDRNRLVQVNDFSTWSGVPSFFRNRHPQVFYKNMIYNVLIQSLYWCVYGDVRQPIPSLQVSNANLTAIIRLDADASGNLDAQIRTINYLNRIARESGVVSLYAWVSSSAIKAGWQDLAPLGKQLEDAGGVIGTHSRFHRINREMNEKRWKEELDDAIQEIEYNMKDYGYDIGKVDGFINPGNTIHMDDYNQVAKRFGFYMTHGFEQDMPIGFGNFTWYNEKYPNFVVLENTPSPDYQWFYDPTWSYTTQQITAYEENIFDHMYNNIQRGVVFNEMWHDYSITSQQQYGKSRIMNKSNIAFYDAMKAKFNTYDIYCPDIYDLQHKIVMMTQGSYQWQTDANTILVTLDMNKVKLDSAYNYLGGMGIRINNTSLKIHEVFLDGKAHPAFNDNVVILPNLTKPSAKLKIVLGNQANFESRLIFTSKRMPYVKVDNGDLKVKFLTKNKAKFSFLTKFGNILLNADGYEWNRLKDNVLKGYVTSDREVVLKSLQKHPLMITQSDAKITDVDEKESELVFHLAKSDNVKTLSFSCEHDIEFITLNEEKLEIEKENSKYRLNLSGLSKAENQLVIKF